MDAASARGDTPIQAWARALSLVAPLRQQPWLTLPLLVDSLACTHGSRTALQSPSDALSYAGLAARKDQVAQRIRGLGLPPGAVVGLMMRNCPDYVAWWLGISQTGAVAALINTQLRGQALVQALGICAAGHVVADANGLTALSAVQTGLTAGTMCWDADQPDFADAAAAQAGEAEPPRGADTALLIFTSGTTGAPKAARISHYRVLEWSYWFAGMMRTGREDRLYNCLPFYHSTGGIAGIGGVLVQGGTVIVRERFSASRFWQDIGQSGSTIFLYIGELCRFLLAGPAEDGAPEHRLRLCCGNGLRQGVWEAFQARFQVPRILEFYAATEGNVSLYNCEGKPGAIGRIPPVLKHRFAVALIACDAETGVVERDAQGHCVPCPPGIAGEAIGRIGGDSAAPDGFDGYTDIVATERKILHSVFAADDAWFRTGDLMRQDMAGYYYFVDRLGDTFRWRGENVSTSQVADMLCSLPGITSAAVYGVTIEGEEGRAGMAAITVDASFDVATLVPFLAANLPRFAWPVFVRICAVIPHTATFKLSTMTLAQEGYDGALVRDPIYRLSTDATKYRSLTAGQ